MLAKSGLTPDNSALRGAKLALKRASTA